MPFSAKRSRKRFLENPFFLETVTSLTSASVSTPAALSVRMKSEMSEASYPIVKKLIT